MPLIVTPGQLKQRAELYHQLGIMLSAGITLPQSLEQARRNAPRPLRPVIDRLLWCLREGYTFTEALDELGRWIPSFDAALLEAGEKSGRLDATFKLLASYYTDRAQMARQTISDLLYPLFVFHFAVFLFPFLTWFQGNDTVKFVLTIVCILGPFYGIGFFLLYACQGQHGERWRSLLEKALHPIPILGTGRRFLALARLAAALEALLNAGMPIIGAWELAATASGSPELRRITLSWKDALENGSTPSEMVSSSRPFPELFAGLYHTGEISGKLDETLLRLHALYQEEGTRKMRAVANWSPKIFYFGVMLIIAWKIIQIGVASNAELNNAINS